MPNSQCETSEPIPNNRDAGVILTSTDRILAAIRGPDFASISTRGYETTSFPDSLRPVRLETKTSAPTRGDSPAAYLRELSSQLPEVQPGKPPFRSRRPVESEGELPVETKYRCRACNHEFRERAQE